MFKVTTGKLITLLLLCSITLQQCDGLGQIMEEGECVCDFDGGFA